MRPEWRRRVLDAMSRPFTIGDQEIFTGCSIGIAVWPEDGVDSEELLQSADLAMYHAKGCGGQVYQFFDASMNQTSDASTESGEQASPSA